MTIVRAITFEGKNTAAEALKAIAETKNYIWLDEVAVISRSKRGFVRVDSTWAQSDTDAEVGVGWGAITGAALGAMMGPGGALAGAVGGGSLGVLVGASANLSFADPRLEELAARLKNNTSALVLVSDPVYATEFGTVFAPYGGTLIETKLNEKDVNTIRETLKV